MNRSLFRRLQDGSRALLQSFGTPRMKRALWDREYASGRWSCLEQTADDFVYDFLGRYLSEGRLLDLGCGSGNTACELPPKAYREYVGVDVSAEAVRMARSRSAATGRGDRSHYEQGDIETYKPVGLFNVILFRDSIYYVRRTAVVSVLTRYCGSLSEGGVLVIRLFDAGPKYASMIEDIRRHFRVVEEQANGSGALILGLVAR